MNRANGPGDRGRGRAICIAVDSVRHQHLRIGVDSFVENGPKSQAAFVHKGAAGRDHFRDVTKMVAIGLECSRPRSLRA